MLFNWTINFGHIITVLSVLLASTGFMYTMKGNIQNMSSRLSILETDIKQLIVVLIQQGKHEERMTAVDARVSSQGIRLDDLIKRFNDKADKI